MSLSLRLVSFCSSSMRTSNGMSFTRSQRAASSPGISGLWLVATNTLHVGSNSIGRSKMWRALILSSPVRLLTRFVSIFAPRFRSDHQPCALERCNVGRCRAARAAGLKERLGLCGVAVVAQNGAHGFEERALAVAARSVADEERAGVGEARGSVARSDPQVIADFLVGHDFGQEAVPAWGGRVQA